MAVLLSFSPMRINVSGASPDEPAIGFSRAVCVGEQTVVSGTGPVGADDANPKEQTRHTLTIIERALHSAGACLADVVRTRIYLTNAEDGEAVGKAHGEVFGTIRPAGTMVCGCRTSQSIMARRI